jgi:hypothetical protein
MKRLLTLALCAASLMAAVSCVKDRPKESTVKAKSYQYFEAVASASSLTADAGTVTLDITANVPWTLTADEGLVPDVTQGSGNASVSIAVAENPSFEGRSFSYSVSTDAELDVDDPEQWTVFGRTLDFSLMQAGALPKFSVDPMEQTVPSTAVSAKVDFNVNIGYQIECLTEGLSYDIEDDPQVPSLHHLIFHFPVNTTDNAVEYRAKLCPEAAFTSTVFPVTVVIRQSALKIFRLDCTDASLFRYTSNDAALAARTSTIYNTVTAPFDFYLEQDGVKYPFYGQVSCWSISGSTACLSNKSSTRVKLPSIEGYILQEVEVTYSHSTTAITYSITDDAAGSHVLASCTRVRSTTEKTVIDLSNAEPASGERYLKASREMCVKFILTYIGVE